MAVTLYQASKQLLCQAINNGNDLYQETLRGTDKKTLIPALAARVSYHGAEQIGQYFGADNQNKILVGLGLAWAFCAYKGLGERVWLKEWSALAFAPVANAVVNHVTTRTYQVSEYRSTSYLSRENQNRARFVLQTVVYMVQACALYKLKGDRNPSLPLKPYLYYGAGVVLLTRLNNRYNPGAGGIADFCRDQVGVPRDLANSIDKALTLNTLGMLTAFAVGRYTGETVLVTRKWEALSTIAAGAVRSFL